MPSATVGGQYEYSHFDGVPYTGQALLSNAGYLATTSATPGETSTPLQYVEKLTCQPELLPAPLDQSGDMTAFWRVREYRPGREEHPRGDAVGPRPRRLQRQADHARRVLRPRCPPRRRRPACSAQWEHNFPDKHAGVQPEWARQDFLPMVTAWYDRHLKGLQTGIEDWPDGAGPGLDRPVARGAGLPADRRAGRPAGARARRRARRGEADREHVVPRGPTDETAEQRDVRDAGARRAAAPDRPAGARPLG